MTAKHGQWDVVVLGGINTDYVIRSKTLPTSGQSVEGDSFYTGPGGKGANQAVTAARLGAKVAFVGTVGNDPRGHERVAGLRKQGIDTRHVRFDADTATGAAIIAVDADGEKQISAFFGANDRVSIKQVEAAEESIRSARVLLMQLEVPMPCVLRAALLAKKHGVKIILDPAPPAHIPGKLLESLDVIRPNHDEIQKITGRSIKTANQARAAARFLLEKGVKTVAMESGQRGDLIITRNQELFLPRLKVKTVDATGAGDAFAGAFAVGMAEGLELLDIARLANATAALATTKVGAQEGLPTRRQVETLLRKTRAR